MGCGCNKAASRQLNRPYLAKQTANLSKWEHLDLSEVEITEEFLELQPRKIVKTNQSYSDTVNISLTARTEKNNIRIRASGLVEIIFNWELNHKQLRVHRSDHTCATAVVEPLAPDVWYNFRWFVHPNGTEVYIDDKLIFTENRQYLIAASPVSVYALDSIIDIKSFEVK